MSVGTEYVPARHPGVRGRWTAERVLDALRDWARETGAAPRREDWGGANAKWSREHPRWPSASCAAAHHGSWTAALEAAGLRAGRAPRATGAAERATAARRLRDRGVAIAAIADELGVSTSSVRNYLAARSCPRCGGLMTNPAAAACALCRRSDPTVGRAWTRDEVRLALLDWAVREGCAPSVADWTPSRSARWRRESPRWPSAAVVCGIHGSWNDALADAGLSPRRRRYDEAALRAALADAWARTGRRPDGSDLGGDGPSARTYRARYGSVRAAWDALAPVPADPGAG